MPLIQATLQASLQSIQDKNPASISEASKVWADAFFGYFSLATAGVLLPTPSLTAATLQASFLKSMENEKFIDELGANLKDWISPVQWVGPGFKPGSSIVVSALITKPLGVTISKGGIMSSVIAGAVDVWAKTITVEGTTTSAPPVTTIFPVS